MTTILEARDELADALTDANVPIGDAPGDVALPSGIIFGEGIDLAHIARGQAQASFRVTLMSGAWDQSASSRTLTAMIQAAIAAIRALDGWRLGEVRRDNVIAIAGGQALGTDVIASRMVDI